MNRDTAFFMGAEEITRVTKFPAFFVGLRRTERGYYAMSITPLAQAGEKLPTGTVTERYARLVEAQILAAPPTGPGRTNAGSSRSPCMRVDAAALNAAVLALALVLIPGCSSTKSRQTQQAKQSADAHRQQTEEAATMNTESAADRAAKLQRAQQDERLRRLQAELAARTDPDSLAAAALFARTLGARAAGTPLDLLARAIAAAPQRADLAFLALELCASTPGCDTAPREAQLSRLDPQNGMPWAYALLRADQANLNAPWRAAREALAGSQRMTQYWNSLASHLAGAAAGRQGFDISEAMVEVIGVEAAIMSPLQPVSRACSEQDVQDSAVLAQCRQIAAAFMKADTVLFEGVWHDACATAVAGRLCRKPADHHGTPRPALSVAGNGPQTAKFNSPQATRALAGLRATLSHRTNRATGAVCRSGCGR